MLTSVKQERGKLALFYLDLDRLKIVNDHLGHLAGDELLQKTSERLRTIVGEEGFIARLGGDEFTIIYRIKNYEVEIDNFSETILKGFETPFEIEGVSIHSKISIGVALYPNHGSTTTSLVQSADSAMFQAKRMGGNQVKRYSEDIVSQSQKIFEFENDFSRALENQEFSLVYQPKIDAKTLTVIAIEALIRWNHPVRGILRPSEFIPIAEKTGLISRLGDWVMREACFQMKQWQEQGYSAIRIAVNVSLLQFNQKSFPDKVQEILSESGLEPRFLEVEITKGKWAAESEEVYNGVAKLKRMGVYVSLDDFGTGDTSISALKKYRYIDALKIAESFIEKVDQNEEKAAIVQSIITLAHGLNMQVVAEGVETAAELTFIQNRAIDQFQGNYITKPLPPTQLLNYLKTK
ncbi:putative bifunctional diguanylate cyclase/phosphodiesterase [Bacillus sp. T3]|uniref:putative bifunctional diguanylate cyclase/phosphodiesterase n=1 Tax=Bacillus sp. T3 TaxID=467262 RepID=UPI002982876B|nr:EAL domain-containing protein [Bacillus sp. T3]